MEHNSNGRTAADKPHFIKNATAFLDMLSESFFRRIRISQRLQLTFILLSILPLCLVGLVSIQYSTKAMEENISNYSIQILNQVAYNLTNEVDRLEALSLEFMVSEEMKAFDDTMRRKDEPESKKLQVLKQLEALFESKVSGSKDLASIAFYPADYDMVARTDVLINGANKDPGSIFGRILNTSGQPVWIYMKNKETEYGVDTDLETNAWLRVQTPVLFRKISSMYDTHALGVLHIAPQKKVLQKICSDIEIGKEGKVMLLDSANMILSGKEDALIGSRIDPAIDERLKNTFQKNGYFFIDISGTRMLVCYSALEETGWKILSMIPFENLTVRINQITIYVVMIMAVCILAALLVSYMVTRSVCLPINRVNETVEHLGRGDFTRKLDIQYADEISNFSIGFNKMVDDMQSLITEVYLTKIEKLDSDFKALQAQINPHFLYNTLESINSLALIKRELEISEMIRGLAAVFRYSIKNNDASVVLKDEMEHVRLYVLLQALRYEDRIKIEYDVSESLMQAKVLKFMLQPLVENAMIHGIEKSNRSGLIRIEARSSGRQLIITVSDNGKGMEEGKLNELRAKLEGPMDDIGEAIRGFDSIGIMNIHKRIKLQFGENCGIRIDSAADAGTTVKVIIPLMV